MFGLMQDQPLLISSLVEFAAMNHPDEEIVSRCTYYDCYIGTI